MFKNRILINTPSTGPKAPQGKAYRMNNLVYRNLSSLIMLVFGQAIAGPNAIFEDNVLTSIFNNNVNI
jgi:hypothetical protein